MTVAVTGDGSVANPLDVTFTVYLPVPVGELSVIANGGWPGGDWIWLVEKSPAGTGIGVTGVTVSPPVVSPVMLNVTVCPVVSTSGQLFEETQNSAPRLSTGAPTVRLVSTMLLIGSKSTSTGVTTVTCNVAFFHTTPLLSVALAVMVTGPAVVRLLPVTLKFPDVAPAGISTSAGCGTSATPVDWNVTTSPSPTA